MTKYYKCGREFSATDIKRIQKIVTEHQGVSRCQLSRLVCEAFDWYSENGSIKGYICRQLLVSLERANYIKLPAPDPRSFNRFKKKKLENVELLLYETFVEKERFSGSCYKAANWLYLGETKGFSKGKDVHVNHGIIKAVYIYIPNKDSKELLLWN